MTVSDNGINFIKSFEGCRLSSYLDSVGCPTIGFGTIVYHNGAKVKLGETITQQQANTELIYQIDEKQEAVNHLLGATQLNQNQFDSLVSFAYNEGSNALAQSTLLKKILINPNDTSITESFLIWDKIRVDDQLITSQGLLNRRTAEAKLYFS